MTIGFNTIPASLRVPLFYAEMDASQANQGTFAKRTLLLGQMLATGLAQPATPYLVTTPSVAISLFGRGSMLARMAAVARANDPMGDIWAIPQVEPAAGAAATGKIVVTGPATASGTISLYVGGQRVQVAVVQGDAAAAVATSIAAAINAALDLPVTAAAAAAEVNITCRWKGQTGNDIVLVDSFLGQAGGEQLPAGVGLTYTAMSGGTSNPSLATSIAAMGDEEYDYILHPYTDTASLDALRAELSSISGRWSYARGLFGHAYTALRGTVGTLVTAGLLRNDEHHTIAGFEVDVPTPAWEHAASYGSRNAAFLNVSVSRPTQTGELVGNIPPRAGRRFLGVERQSLLNSRIATTVHANGVSRIERAITTYGANAQGLPDASYLDSETLHQSAEFIRRMRNVLVTKYGRHSLADNGTPITAGNGVVTPAVLEGELDAEYLRMMEDGLVENFPAWQAARRVERDPSNPNRVNILLAPDYINQLRIIAVLNQFRLQAA